MYILAVFLSPVSSYNPICVPPKFFNVPPNPTITHEIPFLIFA